MKSLKQSYLAHVQSAVALMLTVFVLMGAGIVLVALQTSLIQQQEKTLQTWNTRMSTSRIVE